MSCAAQSLLDSASVQGYQKFDERMLWLSMAGLLSINTGLTATQAIAGAAAQGYYKMEDRTIDMAILALCT